MNWWQWDQFSTSSAQTTTVPPFTNTNTLHLAFQKLDLLVTQMVSFRRWDLMLVGGVTYAGNTFDWDHPAGGGGIGGHNNDLGLVGFTVGTGIRR